MKSVDHIIVKPVVTEKSSLLIKRGVYTFVVRPASTKLDVKKSVEALFGVKVARVNTSALRQHRKGGLRTPGRTAQMKKAVVTLVTGDKIKELEVKS